VGKLSRDKGARTEREIVNLHRKLGIHAERVPLSGGTDYQSNGQDVDIYPWGEDAAPLCLQVKALGTTSGTKSVLGWLSDADALVLRYDAEPGQQVRPPIVVLPWATWERLIKRGSR
jgi:hypothetical protein